MTEKLLDTLIASLGISRQLLFKLFLMCQPHVRECLDYRNEAPDFGKSADYALWVSCVDVLDGANGELNES